MTQPRILSRKFASALLILILSAGLFQAMPALPALAQDAAPVQEIQGKINPGEIDVFVLSGLKTGADSLCDTGYHLREPGPGPFARTGHRRPAQADRHLPG